MKSTSVRRRWTWPTELFWWGMTLLSVALIPTLAMVVGVLATIVFLPTLVVYVKNGRSLGPVGYWYSVLVVSSIALAVMIGLPLALIQTVNDGGLQAAGVVAGAAAFAIAIVLILSAWYSTPIERVPAEQA